MKQNGLFSIENPKDDKYFDTINHNYILKKHIKKIWIEYADYADQSFDKKLSEDFLAHLWEMSLFKILKDNNQRIEKKRQQKGPDLVLPAIINTINIEAITPGPGKQDLIDSIQKSGNISTPDESFFEGDIPIEKIELRISSAIHTKRKQFDKYLRDNTINQSDINIIAVSTTKFPIANISNSQLGPAEYILRTLFPIGQSIISNSEGKYKFEFIYRTHNLRENTNKEDVSKRIFENDEYKNISAIIYTNNPCPSLLAGGTNDIFLIKNNNCLNPLNGNLGFREVTYDKISNSRFIIKYDT